MCYAYNADVWCDDCADEIKRDLDAAGCEDEGDTDGYPQYFGDDEADCPQHCAGCNVFLENSLTSYGYDYVKEAVEEAVRRGDDDSVALTEWAPFYGIDVDSDDDDFDDKWYTGRTDGTIEPVAHDNYDDAVRWICDKESEDAEGVRRGDYYIDSPR